MRGRQQPKLAESDGKCSSSAARNACSCCTPDSGNRSSTCCRLPRHALSASAESIDCRVIGIADGSPAASAINIRNGRHSGNSGKQNPVVLAGRLRRYGLRRGSCRQAAFPLGDHVLPPNGRMRRGPLRASDMPPRMDGDRDGIPCELVVGSFLPVCREAKPGTWQARYVKVEQKPAVPRPKGAGINLCMRGRQEPRACSAHQWNSKEQTNTEGDHQPDDGWFRSTGSCTPLQKQNEEQSAQCRRGDPDGQIFRSD